MQQEILSQKETTASSPVISIILLVGLTVALFSVVFFLTFDLSSNTSTSLSSPVIEKDSTDTGFELIVTDNPDNSELDIYKNNSHYVTVSEVGEIVQIDNIGRYTVIENNEDGSENLINSYEFTDSEITEITISEPNPSEPDDLKSVHEEIEKEDGFYLITNDHELQAINYKPNANYRIANDIDARETKYWYNEQGFEPISEFNGELDGNNKTIFGLKIDRIEEDNVGLISDVINDNDIYDLSIYDITVVGNNTVGSLVANSGTFNANLNVDNIIVKNVDAYGNYDRIGGVIGETNANININNSIVIGDVEGNKEVGGLVGYNVGDITQSMSNTNVTGGYIIGGLTGYNNGYIDNSYVVSKIIFGEETGGGLVGENVDSINNSYTSSNVVGFQSTAGSVSGTHEGFFGDYITNTYVDSEITSNQLPTVDDDGSNIDITELDTEDMISEESITNMNLDFDYVWDDTEYYPILQDLDKELQLQILQSYFEHWGFENE